jgi:hypothetical protein
MTTGLDNYEIGNDHLRWQGRRRKHPHCTAPGCRHRAHFSVMMEDSELADVCSFHYLEITDAIREAE